MQSQSNHQTSGNIRPKNFIATILLPQEAKKSQIKVKNKNEKSLILLVFFCVIVWGLGF